MKYLSNKFNLSMLKKANLDQSMNIRIISTYEAKKSLSDIDGYESLITNEDCKNMLSQILDINIPSAKELQDFTPYDALIVAQPNELIEGTELEDDTMDFITLELNAKWKVDYYSKERELIKELNLGNMAYSEAKKEAFLVGVELPYYVYDIYYI